MIDRLLDLKPADGKLYLVGGAVRDILLQKPGKDFDLICDFDTRLIARAFADVEKGAFYPLDASRNTSRVILYADDGRRIYYDFARMQGGTLESDLRLRDFTINAMAFDLENPGQIIDPMGGAADLKNRVLRACSSTSFIDDPVRVIRAVRYASALTLMITPDTLHDLKSAVPLLNRISRERSRDELLKVLDSGKSEMGLLLLHRLKILAELGLASPDTDIEAAAGTCGNLESLFDELQGIGLRESTQTLPMSSFLLRLGRIKDPILAHLQKENDSGRNVRTLDLLAAWLDSYPMENYRQVLDILSLSNDEREHLNRMYHSTSMLEGMDRVPDGRGIYKFFQRTEIDACLVWLAGLLNLPSAERGMQKWLDSLEICEALLDAWVNKPEVIHPRLWLNGRDLMRLFNLAPGKQVGELLEALAEEQAAGTVNNRDEAAQWVKDHLGSQ